VGDLAVDTAVEPVGDAAGRFRATLSSDWNIWGPNGGYLAAVALRAVGAATALPRPASFTCHYLGVAAFEPVELEVVPLRTSRRAESLRVSMTQGGRPVLEGMAWVVANGMDGMRHDATVAPDVPGPEALPPMEELLPADAPRHAFFDNLEQRPVGPVNWDDRTAGDPDYQAWFRFRPHEHFDDPASISPSRSTPSAPPRRGPWSTPAAPWPPTAWWAAPPPCGTPTAASSPPAASRCSAARRHRWADAPRPVGRPFPDLPLRARRHPARAARRVGRHGGGRHTPARVRRRLLSGPPCHRRAGSEGGEPARNGTVTRGRTAPGQAGARRVACAVALDAAIWTNDNDLLGTGVATWTTETLAAWLDRHPEG
jgi:hypothetical protein